MAAARTDEGTRERFGQIGSGEHLETVDGRKVDAVHAATLAGCAGGHPPMALDPNGSQKQKHRRSCDRR